ncbi:MAG: hypothetical protein JEZ14_20510 [Marinilabiliaceae bacterium]|nr:hypothetical protein [Marinilabiliaceae bacterium]
MIKIDIKLSDDHPAMIWAKTQSDTVNAIGHVGTHIDCYTKQPKKKAYKVLAQVIDCRQHMPSKEDLALYSFKNKALVLYTGTMAKCNYGTREYGEAQTFLDEHVLEAILAEAPQFILIDGCGIGQHGEEHIRFDKKCESMSCFVVENIFLDEPWASQIQALKIKIELAPESSGKPCEVHAFVSE